MFYFVFVISSLFVRKYVAQVSDGAIRVEATFSLAILITAMKR